MTFFYIHQRAFSLFVCLFKPTHKEHHDRQFEFILCLLNSFIKNVNTYA